MSPEQHVLVVTAGPSRGALVVVGAEPVTVGRGFGNDLVLDDPRASRRHLRVRAGGGGVVVEDLGSSNGTRVGGRAVEGPLPVGAGEAIELGRSVLILDPSEVVTPVPPRSADPGCRRARALLERDLDEALGEDERAFTRAHLDECRECRARHEVERAWRDVIADALGEELPASLATRMGTVLRTEDGH